jgi:drug/metabolite transporter (DMT)-like permease
LRRTAGDSASSTERAGLGIALVLLAGAGFSLLDGTVKYLGAFLPLLLVVWTRYTVQALVMGVWLALRSGRAGFRVAHPSFQVLRGALLLSTSVLAFLGLRSMPVAEFTAIVMLAPVVVTLLSPLLLHERVSPLRWGLVLLAFGGGLLVVRPGAGIFGAAAVYPMLVAIAGALFQILTRRMASLEAPLTTHFCTGLVGAVLLSLALPLSPVPLLPVMTDAPAWQWGLMLLAGLFGTFGHLAFIHAVGVAPMAVLMPFTYVQIAYAALLGAIAFSHLPDHLALVGMAVIAVSGALSVWLNVRSGPRTPVVAMDTTIGD